MSLFRKQLYRLKAMLVQPYQRMMYKTLNIHIVATNYINHFPANTFSMADMGLYHIYILYNGDLLPW